MHYKTLTPGTIGSLQLPNRIVFPAMVVNYCTERGEVTPRFVRYHEARARGGAGLLIMEATAICQDGRSFRRQLSIEDDALLPGLCSLTDSIHHCGARIAVQLYHAGRQSSSLLTSHPLWAPSAISFGGETARAMPKADIERIIALFAAAARRAQQAGFDAIELHAAHGYLIQQFLSRFTNHREDDYGGSLENRCRFGKEVIAAVRAEVGNNFPIILRLSVEEPVPQGLTLEEGVQAAKIFADTGIDALHISAGLREGGYWVTPPQALPCCTHAARARAVREAVGPQVPIIAVGRIQNLAQADQLLASGVADFTALGRPLLADPLLPQKSAQGQEHTIRPCIGCNEGCIGQLSRGMDVGCAINPLLGKEELPWLQPVPHPQHIVVVGAGPAGMVGACAARLRGHTVTLLEKSTEMGGRLTAASLPPHKSDIAHYIAYLKTRVLNLGIAVRMGEEASVDTIADLKPDHVLVATGGLPFLPPMEGLENQTFVLAEDVLLGKTSAVQSPVLIVGGGLVGCETAEFLAAQKHTVSVVEMRQGLALDMEPRSRGLLLQRMNTLGVSTLPETRLMRVENTTAEAENNEGIRYTLPFQTLILATGYVPDNTLCRQLEQKGMSVSQAGDCVTSRGIQQAVEQAFLCAHAIGSLPL